MRSILYFLCISTLCLPELQAEPVTATVAVCIAGGTFIAGAIHQWWYYDPNVTKNNQLQAEILKNALNKQINEEDAQKKKFQAEVDFLLCLRKNKSNNNEVPSECAKLAELYIKFGGAQAYKNIMNNIQ
jgi:hypothetical protein